MRNELVWVVMCLGLVLGCGPSPKQVCVPGKSEACIGPGACTGGQSCNADGLGYSACDCGSVMTTDAGGADAGVMDAGVTDAGADAGVTSCNPSPTDGGTSNCNPGQKCAWVTLTTAPDLGQLSCVPDGTVPQGGVCTQGTPGAATGYDNCTRGGTCINGRCARVCSLSDPTSCGLDSCIAYSGLFANDPDSPATGACLESCSPLSQLTTSGSTCGTNKGCYLLTSSTNTTAVCATAGTIGHNQLITGPTFANSCVPGAQPRRTSSNAFECGGLCAPAEVTSTTNQGNESGVAPDSCQARWGAAAPNDPTQGESCRYSWARETFTPVSRFGNTVGFCFKHAAFLYDSNGDSTPDAAFPRCTTLTTGDVVPPIQNPPGNDALDFWCVEQPAMKRATSPSPRQALPQLKLTGWR